MSNHNITLYAEMNREIVEILRTSDSVTMLYAAARIEELMKQSKTLAEASEAALAYDFAIRSCANDPDKMASYCTSQGDTLDDLYLAWLTKSRFALHIRATMEE